MEILKIKIIRLEFKYKHYNDLCYSILKFILLIFFYINNAYLQIYIVL